GGPRPDSVQITRHPTDPTQFFSLLTTDAVEGSCYLRAEIRSRGPSLANDVRSRFDYLPTKITMSSASPNSASAAVAVAFQASTLPDSASAALAVAFQTSTLSDSATAAVAIAFQNGSQSDAIRSVSVAFGNPVPPPTLLGKPTNSAFNADPVNTATGNYVFEHTDLAVAGRGQGLAFSRFYNSLDATAGPLGLGWT